MFNLFKRKKTRSIIYEKHTIPTFKYHRNPLETGAIILNNDGKRCSCCNSLSKYIYLEPYYSKEDISCLCPECISNGQAHSKFDLEFQDIHGCGKVSNKSIIEELCYRTPGYCSWQQENWLSCCDDLCDFIGCLNWDKIKELKIDKEIVEALNRNEDYIKMELSLEVLIDAVNAGDIDLCVFQCLHCKKYLVDINLS